MVKTREQSRTEVKDVISTLEMGANGLVLAGETAAGLSPVECVKMISTLISISLSGRGLIKIETSKL